jgi:hypothetical protein
MNETASDAPTSADPATDRGILLTFYRENTLQSRHYDNQRQNVTAVVALAAALVLGLATPAPHPLAGLLLVLLGGYGFLACVRYHERARLHVERVHAVRDEISRRFP